jgi:diguanylate cyclase (GGDEF)-like protein
MNFSIAGLEIDSCLSTSAETSVYRGRLLNEDKQVIIKVAHLDSVNSEAHLKLEHEFQILQNIRIERVPHCFGLRLSAENAALILEDMGEHTLEQELQRLGPFDPITGLRLALNLIDILGAIHSRKIIHKDINPSNIICSENLTDCALVDFSNATHLSREQTGFLALPDIEGTLAYIAPEQTGRMNREMDYRADFYSLGATLYEMFTGACPFESSDPFTLLHCHIAIKPMPACQRNQQVPAHISAVLAKLLAKSAGNRYQSIEGIRRDLLICLDRLKSKNFAAFEVGLSDSVGIFHLPQRLYGRDAEQEQVLESFHAIENGGSGVLFIGGLSGIGKTALVQETYPEITRCGGHYCAGKFDQLGRNTPYSALFQACERLLEQTLLTDDADIESWTAKLAVALGHNGKVIVDFLPALKPFVTCEPIQELGPVETQNRFKYVFTRFLKAFCHAEHPLLLFLDDLQWADLGTLRLMEHIISDADLEYFLLVGCYRSNELHETHPLRDIVRLWVKREVNFTRMDLAALDGTALTELLADVFPLINCDPEEFTEFILSRTGGNPFFLRQFLSTLHQEGRVVFNEAGQQWQLDLDELRRKYPGDEITQFMIHQLTKFPQHTLRALNGAACIGNEFDILMLASVLDEPSAQVDIELFGAVEAGLIVPDLSSRMSVPSLSENSELVMTIFRTYRFQHDRVQQAAYLLDIIPREVVHRRVGEKLREEFTADFQPEQIFRLVTHLNKSGFERESEKHKNELFQLNMEAAKTAIQATAYEEALTYLQKGLELLPQTDWQDHRDQGFVLCRHMAEVHYLLGIHDDATRWMDISLCLCSDTLEKVSIYHLKLTQQGLIGNYWNSLETAFHALELLGIAIDYRNAKDAIGTVFSELSARINLDNISEVYESPVVENAKVEYAFKIIAEITSVSYAVDKQIFVLINLTSVLLALEHGVSAYVAPAFSCTGLLHIAIFGKPELGIAYGEMGKKLGDRFEELGPRSKAYDFYCNFVVVWAQPLSITETLNRESFSLALDTGDLPFAGFIANHRAYNTFYMGLSLGQVLDESRRYLNFCDRISHHYAFDCVQGVVWAIEYLQSKEGEPTALPSGKEQFLAKVRAPESPFPVGRFLILLMQIHVLEGQGGKAWELAQTTENLQEHVAGTISAAEYRYYRILSGLMHCAEVKDSERQLLLKQLKQESAFLSEWAGRNPHTFSHKNFLVRAEIAAIEGDIAEALANFDLAIFTSRKNNIPHEEALACERAAAFWTGQGRLRLALPYVREAFGAHRKWGCHRRMGALKRQYPALLQAAITGDSGFTGPRDLGVDELLRSVAVISESRNLNQLNQRAIKLLMEAGGADVGALFIGVDENLLMTTYALVKDQNISVELSDPASVEKACARHSIPLALIAAVRGQLEPVIVNSSSDLKALLPDDRDIVSVDIRDTYPQSMSCLPILHQGKLSGLVYLGNTATEHAFTHARMQILRALSGQLSVSIENAMLYENLESLVSRRTKDLEEANSKLQSISNVDGLTNLYNRRYFDQTLEAEIARASRNTTPLSLLLCDIDFFKNYNDCYGHIAGDQSLCAVAKTLLDSCQRTADIAARYGGEEFALILPNTTVEGATAVAEWIHRSLYKKNIPHSTSKVKDRLSLSIGITSMIPEVGSTAQEFIAYADEALYASKESGRDRTTTKNL